jgi:two-component system cell cycle response regulator
MKNEEKTKTQLIDELREELLGMNVRELVPSDVKLELFPKSVEGQRGIREIELLRLRDVTAGVVDRIVVWSFQGLVNHKLRTPLAVAIGFLDILAKDIVALQDAETISLLATAHKSVLRLQDQVLDVLRYLRAPDAAGVHSSRCTLTEIPESITEINGSLGIESFSVSHKGLELDGGYLPLSRQGMELILWELLENAKKFHPQGSPTVEVTLSVIPGGFRLRVADDGLTLSPDQLIGMWIPYYQAEKGFSGEVPGMGLGLPMVAMLVWRVGGTCRAYNREDGPGIVVELDLPLEGNNGNVGKAPDSYR